VYPRCDSKHPVWMPRLRTAPGGVRRWNTFTPRSRGGGLQLLPVGSRLGTASWRALAPDLRVCETLVRFEHRMLAARLAGRAANTMTAGRSVSTRAAHRHLTFCDRETSAFASVAVRLALLFRDRGVASPRGAVSGETSHRSVASVFVITREHHLASRSTLAGSTPPSARCDASPFACERLRGFYAPFADRRRSVVLSLFPLCPRLRAEARIRAPNTSWSPLRGLRYGDTAGLRASFSPGPSQRFRASPAAFASREGGCFTLR
jgi:hypothetical protein